MKIVQKSHHKKSAMWRLIKFGWEFMNEEFQIDFEGDETFIVFRVLVLDKRCLKYNVSGKLPCFFRAGRNLVWQNKEEFSRKSNHSRRKLFKQIVRVSICFLAAHKTSVHDHNLLENHPEMISINKSAKCVNWKSSQQRIWEIPRQMSVKHSANILDRVLPQNVTIKSKQKVKWSVLTRRKALTPVALCVKRRNSLYNL